MRYKLPDTLRGLTLLSMIAYHGMWDLVNLYGVSIPWYDAKPGYLWQQSICRIFILLSGFCWSLGKRKVYRGVQVFAAGGLITMITCVFLPQERILFGILTLLGSCMLLLIPLEKLLMKIPACAGIAGSLLLFLLFQFADQGYLALRIPGFGKNPEILFSPSGLFFPLPAQLYRNLFTTYLGFPEPGFYSSDYFPLLPWIFLFLTGYFLFRWMNGRNLLPLLERGGSGLPGFLGRHSLEIYLLHQPVLYLLFEILRAAGGWISASGPF